MKTFTIGTRGTRTAMVVPYGALPCKCLYVFFSGILLAGESG
jgi:hypothetical protein